MEDLPSQEKNRSASYFKKKGTGTMVRERAASEQSKTIWYGCTVQILRAVGLTVQFDVHDACTISSVQNLSKIVTPRIQISCRRPKHHRNMASRRATKRPNKALVDAEIALPPETTIIPQQHERGGHSDSPSIRTVKKPVSSFQCGRPTPARSVRNPLSLFSISPRSTQ